MPVNASAADTATLSAAKAEVTALIRGAARRANDAEGGPELERGARSAQAGLTAAVRSVLPENGNGHILVQWYAEHPTTNPLPPILGGVEIRIAAVPLGQAVPFAGGSPVGNHA